MSDQERWVGLEDIAAHLGVNKDSVYRWIDQRSLPAYRVGRLYRFRISEVDAWVKSAGKNVSGQSQSGAPFTAESASVLLPGKPKILTILQNHPFFKGIPAQDLIKLANDFELLHFQKGDIIAREGEPSSSFFIIITGKVKAVKNLSSGKIITIETMHKYDIAGSSPLKPDITRLASLEAMTQVDLLSIKKAKLTAFVENNATIAKELLRKYSQRLSNMSNKLMEDKVLSIDQKLFKTLYDLYIEGGATIDLTHNEIADIIGSTSESISRFFKPLKKNGVLEIKRGKIYIKDIEKLKSLADRARNSSL